MTAREVLSERPQRRDVRAIRREIRARRAAIAARRRRAARHAILALLVLVALGLLLSGCGVTPEFERAAQVEAAAIEADLAAWDELSPLQRRMSYEQSLAFTIELLHQLDLEIPAGMTRRGALEALRAYAEAALVAEEAR